MDQDNYYQDRLEVESLQQRLHKTKFLEDDFENQNNQYKLNHMRTLLPVSFSDTEIKSNRQQTCQFKVLYKRTAPLNLNRRVNHNVTQNQNLIQQKLEKALLKNYLNNSNPNDIIFISINKYNQMSLNRIQEKVQAFTFGSEQFPLTNIPKSSHDSKLPPFNKISKSNRQLHFQNQNELPISHKRGKSQQSMDTIKNKENQFVSLNINQRIQTETNSQILHKPPQSRFRLPRKLSNYSRPQSKEDQNRYKNIAEQLKQMFILQKYLLEQGQNAQLQQLYLQFEALCKQL